MEDGILELPDEFIEGTPLAALLIDPVFEVSLTPNLAHCFSVRGIARELSASTQEPLRPHPVEKVEEKQDFLISSVASVKVEALEECPRYACRLLDHVQVGESPAWLKLRLEQSGIRSVNNVVDVTNYVMLELGQPLHAFDLDKLSEQQIVVRKARPGESLVTLDGQERFPSEETLLICDSRGPVAIAGVMGGAVAEVTDNTTRILLEAAYFDPSTIRKSSKHIELSTEASRRFERGVDPSALLQALDRAAFLIKHVAGGNCAKGTLDVILHPLATPTIVLRLHRVSKLLGIHLSLSEVESLLKRLGFHCKSLANDQVSVQPPSYRHDVKEEIDLIEEVARLYGYDHIHAKKSPTYAHSPIADHPLFTFQNLIRERLIAEGLQEFVTCDLISEQQAHLVMPDPLPSRSRIALLNPNSADHAVLRPSLLPSLLKVVHYNASREIPSLAGFEVGKTYFKSKDTPAEPTVVAVIMTGKKAPSHWEVKTRDCDFYDMKGVIENLMEGLQIPSYTFAPSHSSLFHPSRQAHLKIDGREVGLLGQIHPRILKQMDCSEPVYYAEMHVEDLMQAAKKTLRYQTFSPYPASIRDWTILLKQEIPISEVVDLIHLKQSPLLEDVSVIDLFEHEKWGKEWRSVTFRFIYRGKTQTASFKEVDSEHTAIVSSVFETLSTDNKVQL